MSATPIAFAPSQYFDGNDGLWSTFVVRVGNPPQEFRVLPSTTAQETWIPIPEGCSDKDPSECEQQRGSFTQAFRFNESSTWKEIGIYELLLDNELGYSGNGLFGIDTLGLQVPNSGGVELADQVIAGIATKDFYLGVFGLGPRPNNFSNLDHPIPSFVQSLKDQQRIPSVSYGYTAGASYKTPSVFGSLTLGGYDESRFVSNKAIFPFDADDSMPVSVNVESITASNTLEGITTLLDDTQTVYAAIDSTIPHLWLPKEVCDRFESTFGLSYDAQTGLYRANETARGELLKINPSVTIGLGANMNPADRVNIVLPYKAFDLEVGYPIYSVPVRYFPIRRAENASQYRLGRVFLQEAYVIADYERSTFSVHQARSQSQDTSSSPQLTPIYPPGNIHSTNNNSATGTTAQDLGGKHPALSKGAIAGIAVGAWALLAICVLLVLFCFFQRRRRDSNPSGKVRQEPEETQYKHEGLHELHNPEPPEIHGAPIHEFWEEPREMSDSTVPSSLITEKDGTQLTELPEEYLKELPAEFGMDLLAHLSKKFPTAVEGKAPSGSEA